MQRTACSVPMRLVLRVALTALLAVGYPACESGSGEGGETHWLRKCVASSDCDVGSCNCGVCTSPCSANAECKVYGADARCAARGSGEFAEYCGERPVPSGICVRRREAGSPQTDGGPPRTDAGSGGHAGTEAATPSSGKPDAGAPDARTSPAHPVPDGSVDRGDAGTGGADAGAKGGGGRDGAVGGGGAGEGGAACPTPAPGEWHVDPAGSDTETTFAGNGSSACPFKTLTRAITAVATQSPAVSATVTLHHAGVAPSTYGAGCTGGSPCDATPISVPFAVSQPLVIQGDGGVADVILTGGPAVLSTTANTDVSLQHLTVTAVNNGVIYDGGATGTITDVVVQGALSAGTLIIANGGSRPEVGPGVQLIGGTYGMRVLGMSRPGITGTAAEPTVIRGASAYCLDVENNDPNGAINVASAGLGNVVVRDCGGAAIMVNTPVVTSGAGFDSVVITRVDGGAFDGIVVTGQGRATIANSRITNLLGDGVKLQEMALVDLNGSTVSGNSDDGVDCGDSATFRLGSSDLTANGGNGLYAHGACSANFTSVSNSAHEFNATSAKNGLSGLCYLSSAQTSLAGGNSTFSCDYAGTSCVSAAVPNTPTMATATTCATDRDMTLAPGVTIGFDISRCCN